MPVVKNNQIIKEVAHSKQRKHSYSEKQIKFVLDRFFYYAIPALINGYIIIGFRDIKFRLAYIIYSDIPVRIRRFFTYSSKMFGYTFFPTMDSRKANDYGYNFKPNKALLLKISEVTETDVIYTLMEK